MITCITWFHSNMQSNDYMYNMASFHHAMPLVMTEQFSKVSVLRFRVLGVVWVLYRVVYRDYYACRMEWFSGVFLQTSGESIWEFQNGVLLFLELKESLAGFAQCSCGLYAWRYSCDWILLYPVCESAVTIGHGKMEMLTFPQTRSVWAFLFLFLFRSMSNWTSLMKVLYRDDYVDCDWSNVNKCVKLIQFF